MSDPFADQFTSTYIQILTGQRHLGERPRLPDYIVPGVGLDTATYMADVMLWHSSLGREGRP